MLKHRKNVALHAQFFARLRYRERRVDTSCRDCATTLPEAKNHSSASFFLSLVRLAAFRGMLSVDFNSRRASKRNFRLKKISENPRYLRETKISSRTFIRSFQLSNRIEPYYRRFLRNFGLKKSAKICAICGKLKFRPGLPCDPSNIRIVLAAITIDFYSSFFLEKKGPKIQASLKANAEAPEKCCAACTIFCALGDFRGPRADTNYLRMCNHFT
jgi:hypothetical protein